MMMDIMKTNREAVQSALDRVRTELDELADYLDRKDWGSFKESLSRAAARRAELTESPGVEVQT
jgi:prephenate dehydrogenase